MLLSLRNSSLTVKNFPNRNSNQKLYPFCIYLMSQTNFIIQIFSKAKATPPAEKKDPKLDSQQVTSWFEIIQLTPSSITVRKSRHPSEAWGGYVIRNHSTFPMLCLDSLWHLAYCPLCSRAPSWFCLFAHFTPPAGSYHTDLLKGSLKHIRCFTSSLLLPSIVLSRHL